MTDREMLELAAKAAGYSIVCGEICITGDTEVDCTDIPYVRSNQQDESDWYWNPLTEDGDALRLAVKLRFEVSVEPDYVVVMTECAHDVIERGSDQYAATRRAIVRAAAEIGKDKP